MGCGKVILSRTCKSLREFKGIAVNRNVQMCILFNVSALFQGQIIYLLAGMSFVTFGHLELPIMLRQFEMGMLVSMHCGN